jgi:hypothetical protein
MNQENNRAEAVRQLTELCVRLNLSSEHNEKVFTIELPANEPLPVANQRPKHNTYTESPGVGWTLEPDLNLKIDERPLEDGKPREAELEEPDDEK